MELQRTYYRISSCNGRLPSSKQFPQTSNFPRTVFPNRQQTHGPARSSYQTANICRTVFSDRQQTHDPVHSKLPNFQLSHDSFVRPTTNTRPSTQQLPTPGFPRTVFSPTENKHTSQYKAASKHPAFPGQFSPSNNKHPTQHAAATNRLTFPGQFSSMDTKHTTQPTQLPNAQLSEDSCLRPTTNTPTFSGQFPPIRNSYHAPSFLRTVFSDRQQTHDPACSNYLMPNFPRSCQTPSFPVS